jgi:hypothetical protein
MKKITITIFSMMALSMAACSSSQVKTHEKHQAKSSAVTFVESDGLLQAVVVNPSTITAK